LQGFKDLKENNTKCVFFKPIWLASNFDLSGTRKGNFLEKVPLDPSKIFKNKVLHSRYGYFKTSFRKFFGARPFLSRKGRTRPRQTAICLNIQKQKSVL